MHSEARCTILGTFNLGYVPFEWHALAFAPVYLRPEFPGVGSEDSREVPSSSASPPQCEQESIVR